MLPDGLRHVLAALLAGAAGLALGAPEMDCTRSADGRRTVCVPRGASAAPAAAPTAAAPRALALYLAPLIATRDPRSPNAGIGMMASGLGNGTTVPLRMLEQALAADRQSGFVRGQLSLLNQIASALIASGDYAGAEQRLAEALSLARRDAQRDAEGAVLANSAVVMALRGDYAGAVRTTSQAAEAYAAAESARPAAPAEPGRKGLAGLQQALTALLAQHAQGTALRGEEVAMGRELCLLNLGTLHAQLGQYTEAAAAYDRALALYPGPPGTSGSGTILRAKAQLYRLGGRNDEAAALDQLAQRAGDSLLGQIVQNPTVTLQSIVPQAPATAAAPDPARPAAPGAPAVRRQQRPPVPVNLQALSVRPPGEQVAVFLDAAARNTEGSQPEEAAANWRHAAALAQIAEAGSALVAALSGSQALALEQRQPALSIHYGKRAVNEIQRQRQMLGAMDRNARNAFAARSRQVYETLGAALMDAGRLPEAELTLRLMREDAASDFAVTQGGLPYNPAEAALLAYEQEGVRLWKARIDSRAAGSRWGTLPPLTEESMISLRQQLAGLPGNPARSSTESPTALCLKPGTETSMPVISGSRDVDAAWCNQVRSTAIAARVAAPDATLMERLKIPGQRFGAAEQATMEAGTRWLAAAAPGTVALQYLAGPQRLQILLSGPRGQGVHEVPVTREALETLVDRFLLAMERRDRDVLSPARELHRLLVEPVQPALAQMGAQTLLLSLDGRLRYLPMAALHDGQRWLAETYAVALATPAQLPASRPAPRAWRIAAFGSTRAQPRLKLDALPNAGAEVTALVREGDGGGGVVPGIARVDAAFTAEALKAALAQRTPIVHLATHFVLGDADSSFLLLGDGSELQLRAIRQDFRFDGVDLVTLSACETARDVRNQAWSQEFEGLSAALRAQGAAAVLATLWKVDDAATSRFMQGYYRLLTTQPALGKARALQQAQKLLIDAGKAPAATGQARRSGSFGEAETPADAATEIAHPAYWAPFVLLGDVR